MTKAFKVGDKDPYISKIQLALNYKIGSESASTMPDKAYLTGDGDFGPKTRNALMAFQKSIGIEQTGFYDAKTQSALDPYIAGKFVTDDDLKAAATNLQVELNCVRAVTEVEAKGSGYFPNGSPKILFERHVFRQQLLKLMKSSTQVAVDVAKRLGVASTGVAGPDINLLDHTMSMINADIYYETPGGYQGGVAEYTRLSKAKAFGETAAFSSASWGMFQIMGYHFPKLGYKSVQDMVIASQDSEKNHLKDFVAFLKSDPRLVPAMRDKNFTAFALAYNGPAQRGYDVKMKEAYEKYSRLG